MNTMPSFILRLAAACAVLTALAAHGQIHTAPGFELPDTSAPYGAQLSGLETVYGSYDGGRVGFAAWEKFSEPQFSGLGRQYWAGGAGLSATLSQSNEDAWLSDGMNTDTSNTGKITVGGTDYYGRLTNGGYDFTIDAIATGAVRRVTLQIKHSPYLGQGGDWVVIFGAELTVGGQSFFAEGQMGQPLDNFSDPLRYGTYTALYTYRWDNLNIGADEVFALNFSAPGDLTGEGFSVDSIALHVQVPEPAAWAALAALLGLVAVAWRRSGPVRV